MRPSVPDVRITDSQDDELARYRPVAPLAVAALIFGLAAPVAILAPLLWAVPAVGTLLGFVALRRIRRVEPALAGRRLALIGLAFSFLAVTIVPTHWFVHRWRVRNEAAELAGRCLRLLTQDEPQTAYQLTLPSAKRKPLDDHLWAAYRADRPLRRSLERFVKTDVVRTLLALGAKANVRFYDTTEQVQSGVKDRISQLFAVTYEEGDERKTFFVAVETVRTKLPTGGIDWRITQVTSGGKPEGL
ncbi:MAG: DUF4190 domain-containing protein [Thermoguttaceae bacterium]